MACGVVTALVLKYVLVYYSLAQSPQVWHAEPAQGMSLPILPLNLASLRARLNNLTSQSVAVILAITAVTVSIRVHCLFDIASGVFLYATPSIKLIQVQSPQVVQ
ncbi:TPA: hypothetical protein ACH3X1_013268 [Trebouxia sp. C0004]